MYPYSMVGHLLGIYPRVVQLNLLLDLFPIFWESSRLISRVVVPFSNPSSNRGVFLFLHLLPNMCSHLSFWSGPFRLVYGGISGSLWFTFPWSLRILNISSSASQLFEISLLWDLCLVLYPVFDWVEWEISFLSSYLFWIVELVKIFFSNLLVAGMSINHVLCIPETFQFHEVPFINSWS